MLYFFLSYARGDEDQLVQRFFEDLSTEVRLIAGLARGTRVGFVDRTMLIGEKWPQRLVEALGSCQSFLALMTPRYFQSRPCGQEWQIFAQRAARFEDNHGVDTSLLKPLTWIPAQPGRIHPVAEPLQYTSATLGDPYQRLGLRQLMRLHRHSDDYRTFLFELASQIVTSVETHQLPTMTLTGELKAIPSAFHGDTGSRPLIASVTAAVTSTAPMLVHFVVAASDRHEMRTVRQEVTVYGDHPSAWAPYRPPLQDPLIDYAREIAADRSYQSTVADLGELSRSADVAARYNQILVLIVDAWMTRLPERRQALVTQASAAMRKRGATTAVLIPSSRDDPETRQHWQSLSRACREIFDELTSDDELYRSNIITHRAFEEDLPQVLEVARNRLFSQGPVHRPPDPSTSTEPPRIDGPWAADRDGPEDQGRENRRDTER